MAETGSPNKKEWPGWEKIGVFIPCHCFACYAAGGGCAECPVKWSKKDASNFCMLSPDSIFRKWEVCGNKAERKKLARLIANAKWKKGGWRYAR